MLPENSRRKHAGTVKVSRGELQINNKGSPHWVLFFMIFINAWASLFCFSFSSQMTNEPSRSARGW